MLYLLFQGDGMEGYRRRYSAFGKFFQEESKTKIHYTAMKIIRQSFSGGYKVMIYIVKRW
jgi:hypothetical protein